jgi:hypothetical protein
MNIRTLQQEPVSKTTLLALGTNVCDIKVLETLKLTSKLEIISTTGMNGMSPTIVAVVV